MPTDAADEIIVPPDLDELRRLAAVTPDPALRKQYAFQVREAEAEAERLEKAGRDGSPLVQKLRAVLSAARALDSFLGDGGEYSADEVEQAVGVAKEVREVMDHLARTVRQGATGKAQGAAGLAKAGDDEQLPQSIAAKVMELDGMVDRLITAHASGSGPKITPVRGALDNLQAIVKRLRAFVARY